MKYFTALRSEMLKTKRTASWYLALAGAAFIPGILLINVLTGGSDLAAIRKDPLNTIFELVAERNGVLFFPMFVILVCTLLPQIEYRNNTWKQVFTTPQSKRDVFFAKLININFLLLFYMISSLAFMSLAMVVIHFFEPTLNLFDQPFDITGMLVLTGNMYVAILAMFAFQFWLGLRFRNFVVPTGIGFVLWITGLMMALEFNASFVDFFPYSLQVLPFASKFQSKIPQILWTSVGYAVLFLSLGFFDFKRKRVYA